MPPTSKRVTCKLPGCKVRKLRTEMTRQGYCSVEHGITAAVEATRQMANKSGPYYEKWKASMRAKFVGDDGQ